MFTNGNFSKELDVFMFASKDDLAAYREEFGVEREKDDLAAYREEFGVEREKDDLAAYREEFGVEYDAGWDALTSDFLF